MSQLGPVIGNRLASAHKAALTPHLRTRLALESSCSTPLGTIATGPGGRLSFTPDYVTPREKNMVPVDPPGETCTFLPGARVRVIATVEELAHSIPGCCLPLPPEQSPAARAWWWNTSCTDCLAWWPLSWTACPRASCQSS
jgi:hypothetical protein